MKKALAILTIVLAAGSVLATTADPVKVDCPVCEKPFTTLEIMSTNSFGGPDLDLCSHAAGEEPRTLRIWTCPNCRYSRWGGEFAEGVKPATKKRILDKLPYPLPLEKVESQRDIPAWAKYELAIRIQEWEGAPADVLSNLNLQAAWVCREDMYAIDRAVKPKVELRQRMLVLEKQAFAAVEERPYDGLPPLKKCVRYIQAAEHLIGNAPKEEPDRSLALITAAGLLRYRGENLAAEPLLTALAKSDAAPSPVRAAAGRLVASIERERKFQEAFLVHSAKAIEEGTIEGQGRTGCEFIRADTLRRLGRTEEAAKAFLALLGDPDLPGHLSTLAEQSIHRLGHSEEIEKDLAKIRTKRRKAMLARLIDPETSEAAYREIGAVKDPKAIPAVVTALKNESATVRAYAALTLKFYGDPGDAAVDGLVAIMLSDPEEFPRKMASYALRCIASPRSRAAFEKVLSGGGPLAEGAVEALGLAGEESSFPLLLDAETEHGPYATLALSRLTNRGIDPEVTFREWRERTKERTRREWVRKGFAAAGIVIGEEKKPEDLRVLVEALADERTWIRFNAIRALRERTGRMTGWEAFADPYDSRKQKELRRTALNDWRRWLAERE